MEKVTKLSHRDYYTRTRYLLKSRKKGKKGSDVYSSTVYHSPSIPYQTEFPFQGQGDLGGDRDTGTCLLRKVTIMIIITTTTVTVVITKVLLPPLWIVDLP